MNHMKPSLIRKIQNLSKPEDSLKACGGHTTTPSLLYTLDRLVVTVAAGFGRNAEDEHVAGKAEPSRQQDRRQRRAGVGGEDPRERQGSWRIGCRALEVAILRHFVMFGI